MRKMFWGACFDLSTALRQWLPRRLQAWYFVHVTAPLMDRYTEVANG